MNNTENIGKIGIFWDDTSVPANITIGTLTAIDSEHTYPYSAENVVVWKNFMPLEAGVPEHLQPYIFSAMEEHGGSFLVI